MLSMSPSHALPWSIVRPAGSGSEMPSFQGCSWMGDKGQLGHLAQLMALPLRVMWWLTVSFLFPVSSPHLRESYCSCPNIRALGSWTVGRRLERPPSPGEVGAWFRTAAPGTLTSVGSSLLCWGQEVSLFQEHVLSPDCAPSAGEGTQVNGMVLRQTIIIKEEVS